MEVDEEKSYETPRGIQAEGAGAVSRLGSYANGQTFCLHQTCWGDEQGDVMMETSEADGADAAVAAGAGMPRDQRLAMDMMEAIGSLGLQEHSVLSTVGRGWQMFVTEDGQTYTHNSITGHSTWQAPCPQHCL
mmetsp:Transcript_26793/g.73309  ORF Transcript_26793/g.73309 Transcript_26793/m.73309 type:complete len:133 (+) Transcript_26793:57-455(+)|eukprot:scaffold69741_cov37-Tisochrysis_lutea.AAC.1